MAFFDFLTGRKAPAPGARRESLSHLKAALLALNRPTAPWQVREGAAEGVDLVAEWRVVDARWYEIFAKAGLRKTAQILMRFDEAAAEVRSVDRDWTVEWRAGTPTLSLSAQGFRGQKTEVSFGMAAAFREEDLTFGKVYEYRFNTREMKAPLQDVVTGLGWAWKPVAFGKL
jgi:hypothetical protein